MTAPIPEPPDGSIVGWGYPINAVRVRIDKYAADGPRWFIADFDSPPKSWKWEELLAVMPGEPYLLVAEPIGGGR